MNAHALLTSQGWRGTGHSLHPTSDHTGLSRPLLVSKKDNTLGVGKKQHRTSDMWWMNAFDSSLKSLDTSKEGQVVQTNTSQGLDMVKMGGGKYAGTNMGGGLYASFVRGEVLGGTIGEKEDAIAVESSKSVEGATIEEAGRPKKRRKEEGDSKVERQKRKDERQERRTRKAARRAARLKNAIAPLEKSKVETKPEDDDEDSASKTETKEERKERRRLKKLAKEAEKNYITLSSEKAKKKKRRKDS